MRLNIDCVRDILLWVEDVVTINRPARYVDVDFVQRYSQADDLYAKTAPSPSEDQKDLLAKYSNEELLYHIKYCLQAHLIESPVDTLSDVVTITDLTPAGHEFIGNIRYPKVYNQTKKAMSAIGVETLRGAVQVSAMVASEIIKNSILL